MEKSNPINPQRLERENEGNLLMGVVFRLYFVSGVIFQFGVIWKTDKWGSPFDVAKPCVGVKSKLPLGRQLEGS